ncbi:MAG: Fe2+-dependent dioxygenase, partial [Thiobacillus sp.]|nr:Fe2+-dependent dioxygenase [Thiobacillus sp.]
MVVTIDKVLTPDELAAIRQRLAGANWATGLSAGAQAALVKKNQQLPEDAPQLHELRLLVMRALNRSPVLLSAALPNKILPPNFNRYSGDTNTYGWHADNTLRNLPDGSWLRTDVSATLFLTEPADYDGGELAIEDTYGEQRIKLAAGSLVVYPSGSIHEVKPVTRGERLACYFFMQSLVKDTEA